MTKVKKFSGVEIIYTVRCGQYQIWRNERCSAKALAILVREPSDSHPVTALVQGFQTGKGACVCQRFGNPKYLQKNR
jgi:hypothetical protein